MIDCTLEASFIRETPELLVSIPTDAWIENELQRNEALDIMLDEFRAANKDEDEGLLMRAFPQYAHDVAMIAYMAMDEDERDQEITPRPPTGIYGEDEPLEVFTPNGETYLSDDVQFVYWTDHNGAHVVLRRADAYNGYGHATVYDVLGPDGTEPLDYARAQIVCDDCEASWSDEPWGHGRDYGEGFGNLPGYRTTDASYEASEGTHGVKGTLVIDTDERIAFCPVCGEGQLRAVHY